MNLLAGAKQCYIKALAVIAAHARDSSIGVGVAVSPDMDRSRIDENKLIDRIA